MARSKQQPRCRQRIDFIRTAFFAFLLCWLPAAAGAEEAGTGKSDLQATVVKQLSAPARKTDSINATDIVKQSDDENAALTADEILPEEAEAFDSQPSNNHANAQPAADEPQDVAVATDATADTVASNSTEANVPTDIVPDTAAAADASLAPADPALIAAGAELQLEVTMNKVPLNVIGAFALLPDGKLGAARSELNELGIAVPGDGKPEDIIPLSSVPGLSYVYDDQAQTIEMEAAEGSRQAKKLNASEDKDMLEAISSTGAVINYTAYGAGSYNIDQADGGFNGGSVSFDMRAFSRLGTIQQTGMVGTTTFSDMTTVRYDTTWSYSDQKRALSYRLGDIISGGLSWTRPIRMGGGQVHRNFDLRPDLITMPVPNVAGSAKVPSTLDVYVDGFKAYSGKIQEGPFELDSLPVYTTNGTVKVVLTDTTGREVTSESDFSTSPDLLKRDLYDFSVDTGVMRRDFGVDSFGYGDEPVALGSVRYGVTDWLTGEAHAETGLDLISGGAGFLVSAGKFGLFSGAGAMSTFKGDTGAFLQAGWEGRIGSVGLSASSSRTFGNYHDLAAISTLDAFGKIDPTADVPKALDRLSVTYALPKLKAGVGTTFIHQEAADGKRSLLLSGSYSQTIGQDIMLSATAFADFGDEHEYGAFLSVSMPLGETMTSTAGAAMAGKTVSAMAEVSKPYNDDESLPTAWRINHSEGDGRVTMANGAVRTNLAEFQGSVTKEDDSLRGNATIEGSLVMADGSVLAGRKIGDSFAIVNVGAKDVPVEFENRPAGTTGSSGKLLVPYLNSFQKNKISIDVTGLPINADIAETEMIVVPRDKSGVVVNFGVKAETASALVVLTDSAGQFLPESSEVFMAGEPDPFIVGYDGQVYLTGLSASNSITVKSTKGVCSASFDFKPGGDAQTMIGPVPCS